MSFIYKTEIKADWIDYNGHMQDAYYGLIFSYAMDALQDAVGFDQAYRSQTGCTIYLLECHTFFLKEVKLGDAVTVETQVLDVDAKRFHVHSTMRHNGADCAVTEKLELHVDQNPKPHAAAMPPHIYKTLRAARLAADDVETLRHRAGAIGIRRKS